MDSLPAMPPEDIVAPVEHAGLASLDKNHIPVIDRMLDILELIERRRDGSTIKELCSALGAPRSTVYRILNTLESRQVVRRRSTGNYVLGPRLLSFAAQVGDSQATDLARVAAPHMERLAIDTGQSVKFSIIYEGTALVIRTAQGTREFALNVHTGRTVPLHVGATSKVLLASAPAALRERILAEPLEKITENTITDPKVLRTELDLVLRQGWARDHGEHNEMVDAVAAPVFGGDGQVVAALSIPYLRDFVTGPQDMLVPAVQAAAGRMSEMLGQL